MQRAPREATLSALKILLGPRTKHEVKRVLTERAAAFGECAALVTKLRILITPAGAAQLDGQGCLVDVARATRFPAADGVTVVDVTIAPR
jgi:hypothetical protein